MPPFSRRRHRVLSLVFQVQLSLRLRDIENCVERGVGDLRDDPCWATIRSAFAASSQSAQSAHLHLTRFRDAAWRAYLERAVDEHGASGWLCKSGATRRRPRLFRRVRVTRRRARFTDNCAVMRGKS